MNFQVFSDIHIEIISKNETYKEMPKLADNLILAGDIGKITDDRFREFISYCSKTWVKIFFVFGNHEFYGNHSINRLKNQYIEFFSSFNNVFLLDSNYHKINNVIIYGFTGWTRPIFKSTSKSKEKLNDYNQIRCENGKLTVGNILSMAETGLNNFKIFIDDVNSGVINCEKIIVITHFPPIGEGTSDPKYDNDDELKRYFSWNNLLEDENIDCKKIKIWVSGHTHWSYDFEKSDIRYISNQVGYYFEDIETGNGLFKLN